ncbi:MAG: hypothetical protein ABI791_15085 [Acidobacteriota bacterium]
MRNSTSLVLALTLLAAVMGCSIFDRAQKDAGLSNVANTNVGANTNKSITDRAIETAVGEDKVGIPECDEVIDILAAQANNPDDNFVIKATKATFLSQFRGQVRKMISNNNSNHTDIAKFCRDFHANLDKSAKESEANKK